MMLVSHFWGIRHCGLILMLVKVVILVTMLKVTLEVTGATAHRKVLVIFHRGLHVPIRAIVPVRVLISLVPHFRWGHVGTLLRRMRVWLLVEGVLIEGVLPVLPLPQPSNRLVLEAEVRVIRVMQLTITSVWLGTTTPPSDDRAVVLLPLTVARETHIITVANLCLLLL